ncbi:MAG TPA: DUF58 domain-containing protein [Longimicrobiales bacterium]|nr:DUF58 domain-containing protein [Longimicrobiales bacterium]
MKVVPAAADQGAARRLRRFLRPPRRLRVRKAGWVMLVGTLLLGLAALNTGNNLLYLLLGALLGTIALSGWLSEQAIRDVHVTRAPPRSATVGGTARMDYTVENRGRRGSHGLVIRERWPRHLASAGPAGRRYGVGSALETGARVDGVAADGMAGMATPGIDAAPVFLLELAPGDRVNVRATVTASRRGLHRLAGVTISTGFPFGLFEKERDMDLPGSILVWPRTDRPVPALRASGDRGRNRREGMRAAAGAARGEFRALREYRPGDDPRDIHWRSTARTGEPVLRQYDRDVADEFWVVLDTVAADHASGEAAVEAAASLLASAAARGETVALVAGDVVVPAIPGGGLDAALDVLATVSIAPVGTVPEPPVTRSACVLVTARGGSDGWGDIWLVAPENGGEAP